MRVRLLVRAERVAGGLCHPLKLSRFALGCGALYNAGGSLPGGQENSHKVSQ